MAAEQVPVAVRQAASVNFKNHVKTHWVGRPADDIGLPAIPATPEPEKASAHDHFVMISQIKEKQSASHLLHAVSYGAGSAVPLQGGRLPNDALTHCIAQRYICEADSTQKRAQCMDVAMEVDDADFNYIQLNFLRSQNDT